VAIRPIEKKVYKWVYPLEKDDQEAMVWHFEPRLHEAELQQSFSRQFNLPTFDEWVVESFTTFVKKIEIPLENGGKPPRVYDKPGDILRIFKTVPQTYGKYLQLAISGEQPYLNDGNLEKNLESGRESTSRPEEKSAVNAKKDKDV